MFSKKAGKDVVIGSPQDLKHNLHVNKDLDWRILNPETSFKLEEKLGEGSFGIVYKAMHLDSLHELAVKIIEVDLAQTVDLQNEIAILKKCEHPNIVSYFGSCATEKKLWILMDYCGLGSVRDVMETCRRTLHEKEIACILAGTLQGLRYLHHHFEQPIIHKDIKAANILLNEQGEVKLADFGVAQQILSTLCLGYLEGTPHFMAPEIGNAAKFNYKADIWSLGITAIEMAEGRPPYADINIMRAIHMIRRYPPPTLKDTKKWSKEFVDFVEKCLIKDFDERWSAEELLLHPFIQGARPQAMRELCHEAIKAKKKARTKLKKDPTHYGQSVAPPPSAMARWRTAKSQSLVVSSTVERNHGSVVILNTVNVRGTSYHSTSDDSSRHNSVSSKTASLSSSGGSYSGTVQIQDTTIIEANGEGCETVRFNLDAGDGDTVAFSSTRKRPLSSSLASSLSSPQVLSESDTPHGPEIEHDHEAGDERDAKTPPVLARNASKSVTTAPGIYKKETRDVGTQTDLPLDLNMFMDAAMRKKRHKQYQETHELREFKPKEVKRNFLDRFTHKNSKSSLNNYHEIASSPTSSPTPPSISVSSEQEVPPTAPVIKAPPKVPPLKNLPIQLDLTDSAPKSGRKKSPRTPRGSKTPKGSKQKDHEVKESPRKSPRKRFSIGEFIGILPSVVLHNGPFSGLYSSMESPTSDKEPTLHFHTASPASTPPGSLASSSGDSSVPPSSPPSSPCSAMDYILDSSLESLRSSTTTLQGPTVAITVPAEESEGVASTRESPYITPYSTTDESSDSAPTVIHHHAPFAATSPAPFTGPLPCKPQQDTQAISNFLLSPTLHSTASNFIHNITPETTPDATPLNSPDSTPRITPFGTSPRLIGILTPAPTTPPSSTLPQPTFVTTPTADSRNPSPPTNSPTATPPQSPPTVTRTLTEPHTPRPDETVTANPHQLVSPQQHSDNKDGAVRVLSRNRATTNLGARVKAALFGGPVQDPLVQSAPLPPTTPSSPPTNSPTRSESSPTMRPTHRPSHSAPALPSPLKPAPITESPTTRSRGGMSRTASAAIPMPSTPKPSATRTLPRTESSRSLVARASANSPSFSSPPPSRSNSAIIHHHEGHLPSVESIKHSLQIASSPPKQSLILPRTASSLDVNKLAAFMPKKNDSPPTTPTPPISNSMVKNISMAFQSSQDALLASGQRPRASSASSSPGPPVVQIAVTPSPLSSPLTRQRASTISSFSPPVMIKNHSKLNLLPVSTTPPPCVDLPLPDISMPIPLTPILPPPSPPILISTPPQIAIPSSAPIPLTPSPTPPIEAPTPTTPIPESVPIPIPTAKPMESRIPTATSFSPAKTAVPYSVMRQQSSIPLPRVPTRSNSATDVTTKTSLKPPAPKFTTNSAPTSPVFTTTTATESSPDLSDALNSDLDIPPPLSLTPSPPSTPPSSRTPSPAESSSSSSNFPSPRGKKQLKTSPRTMLSSGPTSRPYNRHAQHAQEAAKQQQQQQQQHTRPSTSPKPPRLNSAGSLRRSSSSGGPSRSNSSPAMVSPQLKPTASSPLNSNSASSNSSRKSPMITHTKHSKKPSDGIPLLPLSPPIPSTSPEKPKIPRTLLKEISEKSSLGGMRLPGSTKSSGSYSPKSPRRTRNSPRSPRASTSSKKGTPPSPLASSGSPPSPPTSKGP